MITVAIIGVLAKVAIPYFFGETRKSKAKSEVATMFAELGTKEEQYKIDNGVYKTAVACPASPITAGQDATPCVATGTPWNAMRVQLPKTNLYCSYAITSGLSTNTPAPPAPFTMAQPAVGWYYIVATCDMDGSSTTNSTYFTSSYDLKMQTSNEGR